MDYPGYNEDPKVKRTIDRCNGAPAGVSLKKTRSSRYESEFYQISTLRGKRCLVRQDDLEVYPRNQGIFVYKGAVYAPKPRKPRRRKWQQEQQGQQEQQRA